MKKDLPLSCECGSFKGVLRGVSRRSANRVICGCKHCQRFANHFERGETLLDEYGGTDIIQLSPRTFEISAGEDQIKCLRLTKKGPLRWYAACCKTPIANTASTTKIPFVGVICACLKHADPSIDLTGELGPPRARVNAKPGEPLASKAHQIPMMFNIITKLLKWRLMGDQKQSPFFDPETGKPISIPEYIPYQPEK